MLFNSIDFGIFLPIVFFLYWFVSGRSIKIQNGLIVAASYIFYGSWDWRFLSLIMFSTIVDFSVGKRIAQSNNVVTRKMLLWVSILVNLGFLGFFKYYNFFLDSFVTTFSLFGNDINARSLHIILPVGISFYTFQTLSYSIDVYRRKLEPTQDFIAFSAFVSFFPQLVAGPIERATNLLPQFYKARIFDYSNSVNGLKQILWGLFKKILIADNCAVYANLFFNNSDNYPGSTLFLGAFFFTFQIYGDFSGYSDIAIGTSRLFGFSLKRNFAFPYFSRDIAEFWRRWHISLSSWFKDYLYIPLGGSQGSLFNKLRNIFIIFLVSGLWHGANWTFIIWGALNALYITPLIVFKTNRSNLNIVAYDSKLPSLYELMQITFTFGLTILAWIFFRASSVSEGVSIISKIFSSSFFQTPSFPGQRDALITLFFIAIFVMVEWIGRRQEYAIETIGNKWSKSIRWLFYMVLIFSIYFFGQYSESVEFIYFQF